MWLVKVYGESAADIVEGWATFLKYFLQQYVP
jgi:hypothetical protein